MKRLKQLWSGCLALLVLMICAVVTTTSCSKFSGSGFSGDGPDSTYVAEYVEAITNPSFESVNEVVTFQNRFVEEATVDDVFRSLPEEILINVATVCLKKYPSVTKKDIVMEYRANNGVYDNLPAPDEQQSATDNINQGKQTAMEEQQKPESSVSYRYELDTVDGKPVRTLVKEERTHEK